ncbi:MAG: glycosyltransferase family 10 [Elusimicrobiales bacterium]|jgi:hypothetical protein
MHGKLAIWVEPPYRQDELFNSGSPVNRDDCLSAFRLLKESLSHSGWICHTQDIFLASREIPDTVLFLEIPRVPLAGIMGAWLGKTRNIALLSECEVIRPENWKTAGQGQFDAIFTWDTRLVDNKRCFEMHFANAFPKESLVQPEEKKAFCLMIAAHKKRSHPLELYSERERAVRWFEKNHPEEFDLYGVGWDSFVFDGPRLIRGLNRIKPLTGLLRPRFPSYKGKIGEKREIMRAYKFSICYENAREIPGYITEKIFDSFFAGCVPVYWGAPDISRYVPEDCFIDKRKFATYEQLYDFMKNMSEKDYQLKLQAIKKFLASPAAYPFSDVCFAETVSRVITNA